ncbi:MAG: hypothetical protein IT371_09720 [Deltaproteobacteria bacterium]|nr:hypothetical protein [Deltaproteobacteria bacterium]
MSHRRRALSFARPRHAALALLLGLALASSAHARSGGWPGRDTTTRRAPGGESSGAFRRWAPRILTLTGAALVMATLSTSGFNVRWRRGNEEVQVSQDEEGLLVEGYGRRDHAPGIGRWAAGLIMQFLGRRADPMMHNEHPEARHQAEVIEQLAERHGWSR